jgi:hypothetical protein
MNAHATHTPGPWPKAQQFQATMISEVIKRSANGDARVVRNIGRNTFLAVEAMRNRNGRLCLRWMEDGQRLSRDDALQSIAANVTMELRAAIAAATGTQSTNPKV